MSKTLYIFEVSGLHHDCLQSVLELALEAKGLSDAPFDSIEVVTRSIYLEKLSPQVVQSARDAGVKFHILAASVESHKAGGILGTLKFQRELKSALWREYREQVRPESGDYAVFVTAEMFISPLMSKIASDLKSKGVKLIPMVHNTFIYFPDVVADSDMPAIARYYLSGYEIVVDKFGKLGEKIVLLRKKHLNSHTRKIGEMADGFLLPSLHMEMPETGRLVMKLLTRFPHPEMLDRRERLVEQLKNAAPVRLTVPGQVSEKRRNYDVVLDAVEANPDLPLELVLLGRLVSKPLKRRIEAMPDDVRRKIKTFNDFIDENLYLETVMNSHYLLMPIIFPYGRFKTTGGIGDGISMGVPIVLPSGMIDRDIMPHIQFEMDLLADKLAELMDLSNYQEISKEMLEFARKHTIDRVAAEFNEFLGRIGS